MKHSMRIFVLGSCALLVSSVVFGYALLSPKRSWQNPPTYIVDDRGAATVTDADGGLTATINAITSQDAWNGAGSGTVVNAAAGSMQSFQLGDNIPMLNFEDPTGQCSGNCLAATFTGFYERRKRGRVIIVDADIVTNTAYNWTSKSEPDGCSGEFYIEGVQVHEIGHGLGLGHTNVSGATMFPSVSSCNNGPATIQADDVAGIVDLYGSSGDGGDPGGDSCAIPDGGGQPGDACKENSECCSGKCRGKPGSQTCR